VDESGGAVVAELIADLFVSLDGFAGGVDVGPFFGYSGPDLDRWVRQAQHQPQVVLMGRRTYELMAEVSAGATDEVSIGMNRLPKAVFSNTLREPLTWAETRLLSGDLAEQVGALKSTSQTAIRSIGSLTLVRGLLELGLVDRLRLMVFPLMLGASGRERVWDGHPRAPLQLVGTTVLDARLVLMEYRPGSAPAG
jgi:dihydrofolate reductase